MNERKRTFVLLAVLCGIALLSPMVIPCAAQGALPPVYYQGKLTLDGEPATGWYDFEFRLFDEMSGGKQVSPAQAAGDVYVAEGSFALFLDFGEDLDAGTYYLEAGVRPGGSGVPYTTLSPREAVDPATRNDVSLQQSTSETWRLGVTVETYSTYTATIGRLVSKTASFRSNAGVENVYFMFPAPATEKKVQSAQFYILDRSGSYSGDALLVLEVFTLAGNQVRTVSSTAMDLQSTPTGAWTPVSLEGDPDDIISPGEFLAFHFELLGEPGGDLDVRAMFEVEVE